jgi:hypothetical protein
MLDGGPIASVTLADPSRVSAIKRNPAMSTSDARLNAVIAALEKVRLHVDNMDGTDEFDTATYNRWVGMLEGVCDGNWKSLTLPEEMISASEMLMHVDAAVAFLEAHKSD